MPGKVLVNAFTWERKHTDPLPTVFYGHRGQLLSMLGVDGNARPPPFISEPPRAGAVGLAEPRQGQKPLEVWGVQALRPAHCRGHAGRQRGRETTDSSPSPRGLSAGSVTLPNPDLEKGLPSLPTRQPAGSCYPSGAASSLRKPFSSSHAAGPRHGPSLEVSQC